MNQIAAFVLFAVLSTSSGYSIFGKKNNCPNPHDIHPCYCLASKKPVVVCEDVTSQDEFVEVMTVAKKKPLVGVSLESVSFRYIPENAFEGTHIQSINISDSRILSLGESEHAFKGLEDSLVSFRVKNCSYASHWEWTLLERLITLQDLEISKSHLPEISEDFLKLSKLPLTNINFRSNHIRYLPAEVFASFTNLKHLHLDENKLKVFSRSMLPKPAQKFSALGLSKNQIQELPTDMFTEMPNLRYLYLGGNPIIILDAQTYQPIWNQLKIVFFNDAIHCDCRLSWIAQMKQKLRLVHGTCGTPANLRGRKITQLKTDELFC
ncbi:leucine-rich repeat and fibronectin type-III domain-containing protein 2-like [Argiope bruennichi]|uniref:Leucine-rich repeat and fibronectin type-III like protein n=1 Tax=Argiope bruennichi TaxID=94029 RepID=A0A8T0FSK8_ARGBR|nr:leucine-rich repeat and fibronectin type-III domain-containing protein 2-like [Argiope bruennichi]KAF8793612.1 Leucine-rich repeat and fibronectin type-III like protein [Argiope bruennichi]